MSRRLLLIAAALLLAVLASSPVASAEPAQEPGSQGAEQRSDRAPAKKDKKDKKDKGDGDEDDGVPATPSLDPAPVAALPEPVSGESVAAAVASGTVTIRQADGTFAALDGAATVGVGSVLDTTAGAVTLTSSAGPAGGTARATFTGGVFTVQQETGSVWTDLVLSGPAPVCPAATPRAAGAGTGAGARAAAAIPRPVRRLWGKGKGRFRTRGRDASATVRGTTWYVEDRCEGTLTKVVTGVVVVTERRTGRTSVLRAGQSKLVRRAR